MLKDFIHDESGATAIEYALIIAGIGIAITTGINKLADGINNKFTDVAGKL